MRDAMYDSPVLVKLRLPGRSASVEYSGAYLAIIARPNKHFRPERIQIPTTRGFFLGDRKPLGPPQVRKPIFWHGASLVIQTNR